jgi:hypothetical protein
MIPITIITLQNMIYDRCSNRRVAHLMRYGKTARVRKKNYKRAFVIYLQDLQRGE